ncbi:MAG: S9 family peptidase, partial [Burkholderiales bacterium]|nr:S9 family peptidase [Burkholderiales bacterium]
MGGIVVLCMATLLASAAPPEPLSIAKAFAPPAFLSMRLAPDGRNLVALGIAGKTLAVLLIDAQTLAARVLIDPSVERRAPLWAGWLSKDRVIVQFGGRVKVYDTAGREVFDQVGLLRGLARPDAQGHERVLMSISAHRSPHYIHRIDVQTQDQVMLNFDMPGTPLQWVYDTEGTPLVVSTISSEFWTDNTTVSHWHRRTMDAPWQELAKFPLTEVAWWPMYLSRDGQSLVVRSTEGRDTSAVFRYDLAERSIKEMMAGHPTEDIIGGERLWASEDFLRVSTYGMHPTVHWFDARWAALQKAVDAALPDRINALSGDSRGRVLVLSGGDVDPGHWYLLDTATMAMRLVSPARPDIDPKRMRPKRIVSYTAPDGLTIPAYLTLPEGPAQPGPAVVLIHGGPWVRDGWNWDPLVQLLASRGYAVLQPQFRGSDGFGKRFMQAGNGQWGLAMQDDITASAGHADPKRICIYGASYGGYAAMWGLAKTPELYRCGISFAGVSDLNFMFKDDSD